MRPRSIRARAAACFALSTVALGACGGRADRAVTPASVLRVSVPAGATRAVMSQVRSVAGVEHVAGFAMVKVRATAGSKARSLTLAVGDPAEVEPLTASLAADATPSASPGGLRDGWLLMPAAEREQLGVAPGGALTLSHGGSGHAFRVADLGSELAGTGAVGVVSRDRVPWLEPGRPTLLLIALRPDVDPNQTATTLASTLRAPVNVDGKGPSFLTGRVASKLFGSFSYVINGDGTIRQDPNWVRRYIVRTRVPILRWVTCHRMMVPQLAGALAEVQRAGLASQIDLADFREAGGCYVARQMLWDPKLPVSMHAWGLAIDFNVARNQYGARPTMHPRIVEIFERWGFAWGGRWQTPDGMHFELAALIRR